MADTGMIIGKMYFLATKLTEVDQKGRFQPSAFQEKYITLATAMLTFVTGYATS